VVIGYMGNNIYPFRAGEVLRAYVLRRREQVPMSGSLATVIVERVFDGLVMLMFVFAALPLAPLPSSEIHRWSFLPASPFSSGPDCLFRAWPPSPGASCA
jgi:glycosyltransferase 2 family protein